MTDAEPTSASVTAHHRNVLQMAAQGMEQARVLRDECIADAHRAGLSALEIAEATGLTRARVYQVVNGWGADR